MSRSSPLRLDDESSPADRAAQRRAARRVFRRYCIACGRSTEVALPTMATGRCPQCGGTMLIEPATPD